MSEAYDIHPTEADLDDESLVEPDPRYFDAHTRISDISGAKQQGDEFRCEVIGAHRWITVCSICGKQQGPHHLAEYLEVD